MTSEQERKPSERLIPEEGPILVWPSSPGEEHWALLLDVNVCPFPGCPERHVIVDGFLVEHLRHSTVRPGRQGSEDGLPDESEPEWAFVVSVDVDPPGEVHVEKCRDDGALRWFTDALDEELRAALLRRFDRQRAEFDAVLRHGDGGQQDGASSAATYDREGWSATPVSPDQLAAVLTGFERARRGYQPPRSEPLRRGPARAPRIGRNDPCPCGSGRKYKRCCLGSA